MKHKTISILWAAALMGIASMACSVFARGGSPTVEPTPFWKTTPAGPLTIEPESLPTGQMGAAYEAEIQIHGNITPAGDIAISKGTLPPGLQLVFLRGKDAAKINGTPTQAGTYEFTVFVWCYGTMVSGQSGIMQYKIIVQG